MMRSMYSAVSGLKTHQTRMDVIGNNIANVNTVAFKSSTVTFSDILYQTTSNASGANVATGVGGVNAKQIGLGVNAAATTVSIETAGAAETTGNPFDIRLTDANTTNFFIVNDGSTNLFTRAGSFYVDGAGNLCMTSTGYTVMGWQVDETTGDIRQDTVSALRIMQEKFLTSAPEATTQATVGGVLDSNDTDVLSETGKIMNLNFFDSLGYQYTAKFAVKETTTEGEYTVRLTAVLDSNNKNLIDGYSQTQIQALFGGDNLVTETVKVCAPDSAYTVISANQMTMDDGAGGTITYTLNAAGDTYVNDANAADTIPLKTVFPTLTDDNIAMITAGTYQASFVDDGTGNFTYVITQDVAAHTLKFNTNDGTFNNIGGEKAVSLNLGALTGAGQFNELGNFENILVDFTQCLNYNNSGTSTIGMESGATDGTTDKGRKLGTMIGISIDTAGKIYGSYDNGNTELLGQIAVAQFANASGLEKVGDSCYQTTLNSGEFDGIGIAISADGSSMTTGELEMSNVDLSTEFTYMITTQRGFQANSRVITTSDTLLEELVNLKR